MCHDEIDLLKALNKSDDHCKRKITVILYEKQLQEKNEIALHVVFRVT